MTDHVPSAGWLMPDTPPSSSASSVLGDISAALRVPYLGTFWRSLAWDEATLLRVWAALQPVVTSWPFERAAAELRRKALIPEAAGMSSHQAFKGDLVRSEIDWDMQARIRNYNAAVEYGLAKSLLAAAWLRLALAGDPGAASPSGPSGTIPVGVAQNAVAVGPIPPGEERGRVVNLFPLVQEGHGHPILDEYFRALGRIPDYLNAAWNALKPVVRDELYDERGSELTAAATEAARVLASPNGTALAEISGETRSRLEAVTAYCHERLLPDLLMDVAVIRGLGEGLDAVTTSPYDLAAPATS